MAAKRRIAFDLNEFKKKYCLLQNIPNVFAYNLNVSESKYLPGTCKFYAELNPERTQLRRHPQTISSLRPKFDENMFNFKKINPNEQLMQITYNDIKVDMIINRSPLTPFHTLIIPDLNGEHAQHITIVSLNFSIRLLLDLQETTFRIGYNSPGALASVNHLHLHLINLDKVLYIDIAELELISEDYIYRLHPHMPTEAICFVVDKSDSEILLDVKIKQIYDFVMWLCENNFPHNIFMTKCINSINKLKIFIYYRQEFCVIKDLSYYNIAFCELSGYVPVGDKSLFDKLTEKDVIERIQNESGKISKNIYDYFNKKM
ncbi:GDP-D-glucose phosphorylase 1 isoform X1 [Teleopsis dalmanni]|uniref:GDP-D-glucose phosphorylase 1 isoform X1 n=1 Tax=Teleopsis dalmanni TaxID=139649 RepID=UPI0018CCDD66|nr:GDP-D-glucose phosphorylase 1 isoform X1 [Teleopsis dalmanni]